jgi:hypothetical protein
MSHIDFTHAGRNLMFEMYGNVTLSASVTAEVERGNGHMFYVVDGETPEQVPNIYQQVSAYISLPSTHQ